MLLVFAIIFVKDGVQQQRKKKTPNFTFLGVKLGVNLVNH